LPSVLYLNKLHLKDCSVNDGVYLRIGFVSVEDFVLSNLKLPQNTELSIGDCHFKNFQLTNFRNIGNFKLYKINILKIKHEYFDNPCEEDETEGNKKFQIDNTSIGKTDFQSINLSSFTEIKIFACLTIIYFILKKHSLTHNYHVHNYHTCTILKENYYTYYVQKRDLFFSEYYFIVVTHKLYIILLILF
jgi:hypothetical protein